MRVADPAKFEDLLLRNWSYFVDKPKLIAFVLRCIRDHADLNSVEGEPPIQGMRFTVSKFSLNSGAFDMHVEFSCPTATGIAIGTCETRLMDNGEIEHIGTVGVLFNKGPTAMVEPQITSTRRTGEPLSSQPASSKTILSSASPNDKPSV